MISPSRTSRIRGQSLIEAVAAIAFFTLIVSALVSLVTGGFTGIERGGDQTEAEFLVQEGMEAVRAIRHDSWKNLLFGTSSVSISGGEWVFDGEGTTETIGKFTRTISFGDVCRDSADDIVTCPGSYTDAQTKEVLVTVSWEPTPGTTNIVEWRSYITNWETQDWIQTDWVGGSGQTIWSDTTRYNTDDGNVDVSTAGEVALSAGGGGGSWTVNSGGEVATDTTDTDFNAGTFSTTTVSGSGAAAGVILTQLTDWSLDNDSASTTTNNLNATHGLSASNVWGVANNGEILNYDGDTWTIFQDIGGTNLNDLRMIATTSGWSVGDGGQIYLYDGATWERHGGGQFYETTDTDFNDGTFTTATTSGTSTAAGIVLTQDKGWAEHEDSQVVNQRLRGLSIIDGSNIWAVGNSGTILKYDGADWTLEQDVGGQNLFGIDMVTTSDGWAVGGSGKIYDYNGSTWTEDTDIGSQTLRDIDMVTSSDGWIVANSGKFFQYNGTTWSEFVDVGGTTFHGVAMASSTDGWAVGASGKIYRYNGATWSEHTDIGGQTLYDVVIVSSTDAWAVGSGGKIFRYNGTTWSEHTDIGGATLQAVTMVSANDGWATGDNGVVYRWDGASWALNIDTGGHTWDDVAMVSSTVGWFVGSGGRIYQNTDTYVASGSYLSSVLDSNNITTDWDTINWTETLPAGANITIATRTGTVPTPDVTWSTFSSELSNPTATNNISSPNARYFQYRVTFTGATDNLMTPRLDDVTVIHDTATTEDLEAVGVVSASDVWAVGTGGEIVNYDGSAWSSVTSPVSQDLYGIDVITASDIWAVGDSGKILNYNGTNWSEFTDIGGQTLYDVDMVSASDGWAVGNSAKIFRYNGATWSEFVDLGGFSLRGIHMTSSTTGWAVGRQGKIVTYNGTSWSEYVDTGGDAWNDVFLVNGDNGWAVGNNGVIYGYGLAYASSGIFESRIIDSGSSTSTWDGATWTETLPSGANVTIATRTGNTATPDVSWSSYSSELSDPLDSTITSPDGRYLQYRATFTRGSAGDETPRLDDITIAYNKPTTAGLNDVAASGESDVWAVADGGEILHYDGSTWSLHTDIGGQNLFDVDMLTASDGRAVGASGKIFVYNGSTWTEEDDIGAQNLFGVDMVASNDIWAMGASRKVFNYNGTTWSEFVDLGGGTLYGIEMVTASDGWIVGSGGKIYRYNGVSWSEHTDIGGQTLRDVDMVSASLGWAVGDSGKIFKYNGTSWSEEVDTGGETWNAVSMSSATEGWVLGSGGAIRKYNGTTWDVVTSPTSNTINGSFLISASSGWAVGESGTILRLSGGGGAFASSGSLISSGFDTGGVSTIATIDWDQTIPSCTPTCTVTFQLSTAPDAGGSPGTYSDWYGSSGTSSVITYQEGGAVAPTGLPDNQWIRYQAFLEGDGAATPLLEEVRITY